MRSQGLPKEPNPTSRCFDKNGNGKMDEHECLGDYAFIFALPEGEAAKAVAPFTWVSLNWNPHGHIPPLRRPGPRAFRFPLLHPGAGGGEADPDRHLRRSDRLRGLQEGTKAVPAKYIHRDHIDVGAAVPGHGQSPDQFQGTGACEERPAVHAHVHLRCLRRAHHLPGADDHPRLSRQQSQHVRGIKQPEAWEVAGSYPTKYCIRYLDRVGRYTVSLEGFVRHPAK